MNKSKKEKSGPSWELLERIFLP